MQHSKQSCRITYDKSHSGQRKWIWSYDDHIKTMQNRVKKKRQKSQVLEPVWFFHTVVNMDALELKPRDARSYNNQ